MPTYLVSYHASMLHCEKEFEAADDSAAWNGAKDIVGILRAPFKLRRVGPLITPETLAMPKPPQAQPPKLPPAGTQPVVPLAK